MWDDRSFSTQSFDSRSWLMGVVQAANRLYLKATSAIQQALSLSSRLW